uniref:Uncharacterized protein n=1 Tax=Chromera velia CCMP2878 TaxID=1169474 RepID=A0A0G4ICW8_9ALVE|eukprot:Cvel_2307.t1-p1 / transcript=Cvel_2307.t1 / gene=Cvel_2307 / organism=Chromera_velia_CCMP2878 / gene_product=hypothetical protein / transcript_product=hypothetical protein / location=Cvel_scaffold89:73390-75893(-) / protein_length=123 / sequence_SO=supercontig / SO=protein_coding / is_pseudo=false
MDQLGRVKRLPMQWAMAATRSGENPTGSWSSKQWMYTSSSCLEGQETRLPYEGDGDDFNADLRAGCKGSVGEGLIGPELAAKVRGGPGQARASRLISAELSCPPRRLVLGFSMVLLLATLCCQ